MEPINAAEQIGFSLLSWMIFLPLLTAGILFCTRDASRARRIALGASLLELVLSIVAVIRFEADRAGPQLFEHEAWITSLNVYYSVGVDGLSILFLPSTALLFAGVTLVSWTRIQSMPQVYFALMLALEGITIGIYTALDLVLFFVFWELSLVPIYFLISLWGIGPDRRHAATQYTLLMLVGGVPLLFAIVLLGLNRAEVVGLAGLQGLSFDYMELLDVALPASTETLVFGLLFVAFAIKAPLFPFHAWLPRVAMEGPVTVSAFMVGLKLGAYGLLRFAVPLAPHGFREYFWLVGLFGAIGVIYAGLISLTQTNLRRMLAYSSVSHVGLVVMGIAAANQQGLQGAIYQLINFAVVSGGLFLVTGFLHHRVGSTDLGSLGGIASSVPRLSAFFLLFGLASIGLPGTNGFIAEHLIMLGAAQKHLGLALAALTGVILSAAYFLGFYQRAFLGPVSRPAIAVMQDLRSRELVIVALAAGLILLGGTMPQLILDITQATARAWLARLD